METDRFKTDRINELLYRLKCGDPLHDDDLAVQQDAFNELLSMGLSPEKIEDLVKDIDCQEILDSLNDDLLGC
jgi:hypothetical protein